MCGLTGILRPAGCGVDELRHELLGMAATLRHRGPDSSGWWCDERGVIGLAHQRLAIQDLSPAGHQPMVSASGRYWIVYNGEIYNFVELRTELRERMGAPFVGGSDTEVMLAAFEAWGVERALERFVGMFAFALWDQELRLLYLARDRMGEKPLYYGWQGNSFLFGSELKALRRCRDWCARIDRNVLPLLLRHNYIPAPYSIYQGIYKLMPGTYVTVTEKALHQEKLQTYWSAREVYQAGIENPYTLPPEEIVERLEMLLTESVRQQLISDAPLGAFLSGGVDSSTIVSLMQSLSDRPVKTFTIGFDVPEFNEAEYAKAISQHLGCEHTELYVAPEQAMDVIPELPVIYDEPFADPSQIPTHLVARLARCGVTVALSGDGGDELFCGYTRYAAKREEWSAVRSIPLRLRKAAAAVALALPERLLQAAVSPAIKAFTSKSTDNLGTRVHERVETWRSEDLQSFYRQSVSFWREPQELVPGSTRLSSLLDDPEIAPRGGDELRLMMFLDAVTYLPDDILVKVDRAAMAVSLETRIPLLDHRVVEFASRLPATVNLADGRGKWPLRQLLYRHVPRDMVERPKSGFAVPLGEWLRGPLRDWASGLLSPARLRAEGFLNASEVEAAWHAVQSDSGNDAALRLWSVLMFQSWVESTSRVSPGHDRGEETMPSRTASSRTRHLVDA